MNENIFHIFHPDRDKNTRTVFVSAAQFGVKYGFIYFAKGNHHARRRQKETT